MRNELMTTADAVGLSSFLNGMVGASEIVAQQNDNDGEDLRGIATRHLFVDSAVVSRICLSLISLQAERVFCIKQQSSAERSVESHIARKLGYGTQLDPDDRKKLFKQASAVRKAVEKGGGDDRAVVGALKEDVVSAVAPLIILSANARAGWNAHRKGVEKEMRKLAKQMPVWPWVEAIPGFGEMGLAVIVGEAGDLSGYGNPAKLWKRMGLAVLDGKRQGAPGAGATAEDWTRHGYVARRRAEVWAFVDDVMLRQQWRGDKDEDGADPKKSGKPIDVPAHAIGVYGEAYGRKKLEYIERAHPAPDRAARRYMAKRLLRDLWQAWMAADGALEPGSEMPPSNPIAPRSDGGETRRSLLPGIAVSPAELIAN